MEQNYPDGSTDAYYYFRKAAAKNNTALKSREKTAELLGISSDSLKAYETGKTHVPSKVVLKMCVLYNAPELRNFHCRYYCPVGETCFPEIKVEDYELSHLTLRILKSFHSVSSARDSLIEIAADNVITDDERSELDKILVTLDEITMHAQELREWIKKNLNKKKK